MEHHMDRRVEKRGFGVWGLGFKDKMLTWREYFLTPEDQQA